MNIWVINQFAGTPENGWGERHFYFSKYWIGSGHRVTIISGAYNHMFSKLPDAPRQFNFQTYDERQFCWVKTPRYKGQSVWRFYSMMVFALKILFIPLRKAGRPDVIIVSSMPIFPILTGVIMKWRFRCRLIFEIRDMWPLSIIHLLNKSERHPAVLFIGWFEKLGYKRSDYIVSLLPASDNYINKISGRPEKFRWIPNGLSEDVLDQEPLPAEISELIPRDKFIVGYTGTFGMANALEYFVQTANLLTSFPEISLVLVGDGYLRDELKKMSEGLHNVVFIPKIKKNQVQAILARFEVCFVGRNNSPLFEHGVSANKYFDYMLASKPILDSNNMIKDPVELSGCGIIVPPDSSEAIADGILQLYRMTPEERYELGQKGREYLKKYHSIEYLSAQYQLLFE